MNLDTFHRTVECLVLPPLPHSPPRHTQWKVHGPAVTAPGRSHADLYCLDEVQGHPTRCGFHDINHALSQSADVFNSFLLLHLKSVYVDY